MKNGKENGVASSYVSNYPFGKWEPFVQMQGKSRIKT
jgi:hypothetical protein